MQTVPIVEHMRSCMEEPWSRIWFFYLQLLWG